MNEQIIAIIVMVVVIYFARGLYYKQMLGRFPFGRLRSDERAKLLPRDNRSSYLRGVEEGRLSERQEILEKLNSEDARKISGCTGVYRVARWIETGDKGGWT